MNSGLVAYIRGNMAGSRSAGRSNSVYHYLHVYYEEVVDLYRERVVKLGV